MSKNSTLNAPKGSSEMVRGDGVSSTTSTSSGSTRRLQLPGLNNVAGPAARPDVTNTTGSSTSSPGHAMPTPREMDKIIAKEMTDLSLQEREMAENDVHGIASSQAEDPLALHNGLLLLHGHLEAMKHGTVYEEAEKMNWDYVKDHKLRMMFLRADLYDPKEAAERMIRFFELKKTLFGAEKLVKNITLEDLDEADMECLRSGYLQLPPYTDVAGRTILIGMPKLRQMKSTENASRVAFYVHMVAMESEEAQKRGMVCVYYLLDATNFSSVTGNLRSIMPAHIGSLHLCYNDITQYAVTCMGVYALNHNTKVRFRPHIGSHIEVQYALTTFGIPREAVPVSSNGDTFTDQHERWIENRRKVETARKLSVPQSAASSVTASSVDNDSKQPSVGWSSDGSAKNQASLIDILPNDVLFGRGKTVVEHIGNLRFRKIVGSQMDEYEKANRLEKTYITEKIVDAIKSSDGRFLKRDDGGEWEEVDQETARKKVAHAFRNRRKLYPAS